MPQFWTHSSVQSSMEGEAYDPAYEWPGESSSSSDLLVSHLSTRKLRPNQPSFRLIVLHTSILPSKHRLAVIDGYSELQFGRDIPSAGSTTPKLRLKEMEVSKLHTTVYWDASRVEWNVVDMGSMHGTFLQPASSSTGVGDDPGVRLSPPRTASVPRKLHHMDRLTIGGTTFLVHMHEDRLPCQDCSPSGGDEIPLFPVKKGALAKCSAGLGIDSSSSSCYSPQPQKDPRKALSMLKQSLLIRHETRSPSCRPHSPGNASTPYVDRSARRRALHPSSLPDTPGVPVPSVRTNLNSPTPRPNSPDTVTSQPPAPLPTSNIGHRLLMKQGWEPGTALGILPDSNEGRMGLVEPLDVTASLHRVGLGIKRPSTSGLPSFSHSDWKERAKRKRWEQTTACVAKDEASKDLMSY